MWVTRIKIKHDCIIGTRCKKFGITSTGTPFNVFVEKGIRIITITAIMFIVAATIAYLGKRRIDRDIE